MNLAEIREEAVADALSAVEHAQAESTVVLSTEDIVRITVGTLL